jgi:hypothetical protein
MRLRRLDHLFLVRADPRLGCKRPLGSMGADRRLHGDEIAAMTKRAREGKYK